MPNKVDTKPKTNTDPELIALRFSMTMSEDKETAEILVYGYIVSSTAFYRMVKLDTDDMSASDFDKALKKAKASGAKNLHLRINSGGGVVPQAQAMRTMLLGAGFDTIVVTVDGICASAATLLACIPNAHVRVSEGSEFMIHRPRYGAWGTIDDLRSAVQRMDAMQETVCGIYANHTQKDEKQVMEWMTAETWFTAKKAVEAGFAHEVYKGGQAIACVAPEMIQAMKTLYEHVPEDVAEAAAEPPEPAASAAAENPVSSETPVAMTGVLAEDTQNSEEETKAMANENTPDVKTMTLEELRAQNPALYESAMKAANEEEAKRRTEIDAMTPPGYEAMATKAKQDGTGAQEYYKQVVAAQKEKAAAFVTQRTQETAPAAAIPGAASETDNPNSPEAASDKAAQDIATYAKAMSSPKEGGMY